MKKKTEKELLTARVQKVKEFLKHNGHSRAQFMDRAFGPLYSAESNRIKNLWDCTITDKDFTIILEAYAEFPQKFTIQHAEFERFVKFTEWYKACGGEQLTIEDIENVYPKFKIPRWKQTQTY